jgi:hypothetical protein
MLYLFHKKIYIKPFDNKIVEVKIEKNKGEYNVIPTKSPLVLNAQDKKDLIQITLEDAYNNQNKGKEKEEKENFTF